MWHLDSSPPIYLDGPRVFLDAGQAPLPPERTKMIQLALGLSRRNLDQKISLATDLVAGLTNNTYFTDPDPELAAITAKIAAIGQKRKDIAKTAATLATQELELDQLEQDLGGLITQTGAYIISASKGDPVKVATTNAPIKGEGAPVGALAAPGNLRLTTSDQEGALDGMCDRVYGAASYLARYSTSANGPWTQGYAGSASRFTLTGLVSGQEYFVQVCAVGPEGPGPWSDIARKRAS